MSIQLLVRGGALVIGIVGSIHTVYLGLHEIRQVTDSKYVELYNKNNPENKIDLNSLPQYGTPEYDKFNAFQHAYGSAYLAYNFGYEISYIAGILKELITWTSEPDIDDRQRDLWNNEQGQITAIREKLNNKNLEQISEEIYNEIYNNPNTDYIIDPDNTDNKYLDEMTIPNIIQDMFIKLGVAMTLRQIGVLLKLLNTNYDNAIDNIYELYKEALDSDGIISVCRLGFNPTSRNWNIKTKLENVA